MTRREPARHHYRVVALPRAWSWVRGIGCDYSSLLQRLNPLQRVDGFDDGDALIGGEREQVVIARDDDLGLSGECAGGDVIIIRIAHDVGM